MGFYSVLAGALAPRARVLAIEMQPLCTPIIECGLQLNRIAKGAKSGAGVKVLNRFVSSTARGPLGVPRSRCDTMASPSAVRGRKPGGTLRNTAEARQDALNASRLQPVHPIDLGRYLLRHVDAERGERVAVIKVDTEGFEPLVLESLRPAWKLLDDVVFETQPQSWVHHNISLSFGLAVFRELIAHNSYRVVSLPKRQGQKNHYVTPDLVDPCAIAAKRRAGVKGSGLYGAQVLDGAAFEAALQRLHKSGGFPEYLLTRKVCPAAP